MLNTVYQLKRPRQFEVAFKEMEIDDRQVIVRPTRLSICHADQRYYQGARAEEILRQKLPMALIHEGIGKVIYDPTGTFEIGTEVVMIPNRPVEKDDIIAENYLRSSKFCASSMDGFLQEYVQAVPDRFVRLPQGINPTVAAYTELVSVSFHAINRFLRFSHERRDVIGVWGDGNLGYITSLLLKKMDQTPPQPSERHANLPGVGVQRLDYPKKAGAGQARPHHAELPSGRKAHRKGG